MIVAHRFLDCIHLYSFMHYIHTGLMIGKSISFIIHTLYHCLLKRYVFIVQLHILTSEIDICLEYLLYYCKREVIVKINLLRGAANHYNVYKKKTDL